jgi:predicted nucleotidyltransferase
MIEDDRSSARNELREGSDLDLLVRMEKGGSLFG